MHDRLFGKEASSERRTAVKLKQILLGGTAVFGLALAASQGLAAEAKEGKATYDKLCASCHGADGKGNPAMAKALGEKGLNLTSKETAKLSDDDALKVITEGRGKMPAAGKGLSKQEQKDLLGYVRSLAK
ncbi:MAG: cytochrome c [Deltaproteobacteria bacterium]|nr:MAG: cytochrome c [Deltaproteobacteria bacterium]